MRIRLAILAVAFSFILSATARADETYTLAVDYSALIGVPGSTLDLQFTVASIITTTTSGITSLADVSVGGALTGCVASSVELDNPGTAAGDLIVNFAALCGPSDNFDGAAAFFDTPLLAPGVYTAIGHHNQQVAGDIGTLTITAPEPGSALLLGVGLVVLAYISQRVRSSCQVRLPDSASLA